MSGNIEIWQHHLLKAFEAALLANYGSNGSRSKNTKKTYTSVDVSGILRRLAALAWLATRMLRVTAALIAVLILGNIALFYAEQHEEEYARVAQLDKEKGYGRCKLNGYAFIMNQGERDSKTELHDRKASASRVPKENT